MNTDQKLILTDCDGVLLNWGRAFAFWMDKAGYVLHDDTAYAIETRYRITKAEADGLVKKFNSSPEIGILPPLRDAVEYVRKLHFEHGYRFLVITSLGASPETKAGRVRNLQTIFGPEVWKNIICLPVEASKKESLMPYRDSNLFWIEDKIENAELGLELGLRSLVMNQLNNQAASSDAPRFDTWKEIHEYVLKNS